MGGWTIETEVPGATLTADEQAVFDKAAEGTEYKAVSVLATQVVAGTNYAFLCTKGAGEWDVVVVYADLQGNAQITSEKAIDVAEPAIGDGTYYAEKLAGGWNVPEPGDAAKLPDNAANAFDAAFEGYVGVKLSPVALLGTQVVSGMNYRVLCKGATVTAEPANGLYIATVYEDAQGACTVSSVDALDLLALINN